MPDQTHTQNGSTGYQKRKKRNPRKITARYLENAGLYYLERYASSSENFRRVMKRKIDRGAKFHEQDVEELYPLLDALIERYKESGLLNDALYSFSKVRSMRERGTSARMIYAKLTQKGLSREDVDRALEEYETREGSEDGPSIEYRAGEKYARKRKLGPYRIPYDPERMEKDMAAMARAGYSYDIVKSVLTPPEDWDERS